MDSELTQVFYICFFSGYFPTIEPSQNTMDERTICRKELWNLLTSIYVFQKELIWAIMKAPYTRIAPRHPVDDI